MHELIPHLFKNKTRLFYLLMIDASMFLMKNFQIPERL